MSADSRVGHQKFNKGQLSLVEFLVFNTILDALIKRGVNRFMPHWFICLMGVVEAVWRNFLAPLNFEKVFGA